MDGIISADDQTVDQAMAELEAWGKETPAPTDQGDPTAASASQPNAPATEEVTDQAASPNPDDGAPAAKDQQKPEQQKPDTKPGEKPADAAAKDKTEATPPTSKYEKAKQRLEKTWDEVNKEKEFVRTAKDAIQQREAALKQREEALNAREAKLSQPKYKPEDYDGYANTLESQAKQAEEAGDYTKAERLRGKAEDAREYAKQLRENPPKPDPTEAQRAEQFKAQQKEWWGKAAVDFPAVTKEGTPERAALVNLLKQEPDIVNDPKGMYYASRLVTAEALSARVPTLEKDLAAAQARVKELEQLTTVPTDGSVQAQRGPKSFGEMNQAEQLASLEAEAQQIGYIN